MSGSPFRLAVYDWGGTFRGFLTTEARGVALRTVANGGCLDMDMTLTRRAILNYPDVDYPFDVRVSDNAGVFWRGRMERRFDQLNDSAEEIKITVIQANADDQGYAVAVFVSGTSVETCISTVRTDKMPKVTSESLVATGRNLTADLTFTGGKKARTVIQALADLGNSANLELVWGIWPDGTDAAYQLQLTTKPTAAAYVVDIRNVKGQVGWDGERYANKITVIYNGGASSVSVEDTTLQGAGPVGVNLIREKFIEMPDMTNATDATAAGNRALLVYKVMRSVPESLTITAPWAITDTNRQQVPLWRVRAGKRITIRGLQPLRIGNVTDGRNTPFITRTEYAADTGTLSLTFESLDQTLEGAIADLRRRTEI